MVLFTPFLHLIKYKADFFSGSRKLPRNRKVASFYWGKWNTQIRLEICVESLISSKFLYYNISKTYIHHYQINFLGANWLLSPSVSYVSPSFCLSVIKVSSLGANRSTEHLLKIISHVVKKSGRSGGEGDKQVANPSLKLGQPGNTLLLDYRLARPASWRRPKLSRIICLQDVLKSLGLCHIHLMLDLLASFFFLNLHLIVHFLYYLAFNYCCSFQFQFRHSSILFIKIIGT